MKNTSTITIALTIVIVIGGLFWLGSTNTKGAKKSLSKGDSHVASVLTAVETAYDFGTISMKNGLVEKTFALQNPTASDITIKKITTSCMCTKAYAVTSTGQKGPFSMEGMGGFVPEANQLVKAGESIGIKAVYDPNAHGPAGVGPIAREIYVKDQDGRIVTFKFKAVVRP